MLDVLVPEISLERPRVVASIGQRKAAGMPEHVRMRLEAELRLDTSALNHPGETCGREWRSPLGGEDEGRLGFLLAL